MSGCGGQTELIPPLITVFAFGFIPRLDNAFAPGGPELETST